jgi:predicted permease
MTIAGSVASFVGMFILMIATALLLRRRGVLRSEHSTLLSVLLLDIVCPPLIFSSIAKANLHLKDLVAAGAVFGSEIVICFLSYLIGRWALRLDRLALGAFVIAATFGSTGLIGNALVQVLFRDNTDLVSMSMFIGNFGVGIPGNTIGIFLAMRFGTRDHVTSLTQHFKSFLVMPCMVALYAGLVWSIWKLPTSGMGLDVVFGASRMIGASLPFVTAMVVGLSLEKLDFGKDLGVLAAGALLALIVEPWVAEQLINMYPADQQTRLITVLFSAMPSTPLGVVFAVRYGGDVSLAGKLATFTLTMSAITLPLMALKIVH